MYARCHRVLKNTAIAGRYRSTFAVIYESFGDPTKVLKGVEISLPALSKGQVMLKLLAAPVNPADINMIQGVYPVKPSSFPAVGGNEAVAEVVEVSPDVKTLNVGDWVLPAQSGSGTWQTYKAVLERDLVKISNDIPVICAATLTVNPRTAYRMLFDFENLQPGDTIIQNGANSGVGQAVIQIAAKMGLYSINIVRDRPKLETLVASLKECGASQVFTNEMLKTKEVKDLIQSLPKPKLGLNCVGGKESANLLKYLDKGATMITYGGMSKQPLMVPAGPLIFNDVKLRGFWITQWTKDNRDTIENHKMNNDLTHMIKNGEMKAPFHSKVNVNDFQIAVEKSMQPYLSEKQILVT